MRTFVIYLYLKCFCKCVLPIPLIIQNITLYSKWVLSFSGLSGSSTLPVITALLSFGATHFPIHSGCSDPILSSNGRHPWPDLSSATQHRSWGRNPYRSSSEPTGNNPCSGLQSPERENSLSLDSGLNRYKLSLLLLFCDSKKALQNLELKQEAEQRDGWKEKPHLPSLSEPHP